VNAPVSAAEDHRPGASRVLRHALVDRVLHWSIAACVFVLLGTAFLPIFGMEFAWVDIHWMTGVVLAFCVLVHTLRSLVAKSLRSMWVGMRDLADAVAVLRFNLRQTAQMPPAPGKYSLSQKLMHHAMACFVLTAVVTGLVMLAKIDTPWWQRNPYFLADATWGIVYVLHGLAAMGLITLIITHVYFALLPDKRVFLRTMLRGWMTRAEFAENHDPNRWRVDP
jgi:cytochrome b subunit of formate dehydrogenase